MLATQTRLRVRRLAHCVATLLALSPPLAMALPTTWTVNSCSDAVSGSGTSGTLRYAVQHAASGDVVDMSHLSCSTISLHTGAIHIAQSSLTLEGNNNHRLTITGKYNGNVEHDRIIDHTGTLGTLYLDHINVGFGYLKPASGNADGGCIYSAGNVSLFDAGAYYCKAAATGSANAYGGAVFTRGILGIQYGTFSSNIVTVDTGGYSFGGAVSAGGTLVVSYSTFSNNAALGAAGVGNEGAVQANGDIYLTASTVSANYASGAVGGIGAFSSPSSAAKTTITNSTISGNTAGQTTGGLWTDSGKVYLNNSTIAFNTAGVDSVGGAPKTYYAAGVAISDAGGAVTLDMRSTLIANNTFGTATPINADFSVPTLTSNITLFGTNNLIRTHVPNSLDFLPAKTLEDVCPLLGPLRDNGGLTQTHALLSHSPGIDQGNNSRNLNEDQRGVQADFLPPFPYARVSGSTADIGAYEVQQNDIIFNAAFDGCPSL